MKRFISVLIACITAFVLLGYKQSDARSKRVEMVLDEIVEVCADHWEDRHGFASTCAMMAFQESGCGQVCRENNLWGLNGGKSSYPSLRAGIEAWLRVINLEYYDGSSKAPDGDTQLRILLDNGYCVPQGNYYWCCMRLKEMYNLDELDDRMFEVIEKRNEAEKEKISEAKMELRKNRQQGLFKVVFDESAPVGSCITDSEYIKNGSTIIFGNNIYEVYDTERGLGNTIILGKPSYIVREIYFDDDFWGTSDREFKLQEVIEDAVG